MLAPYDPLSELENAKLLPVGTEKPVEVTWILMLLNIWEVAPPLMTRFDFAF